LMFVCMFVCIFALTTALLLRSTTLAAAIPDERGSLGWYTRVRAPLKPRRQDRSTSRRHQNSRIFFLGSKGDLSNIPRPQVYPGMSSSSLARPGQAVRTVVGVRDRGAHGPIF
jgi:hypothetical protein